MNHEARRRRLDRTNSRKQLDFIYSRDKGICWLCKKPVERVHASRDHVKKFSECETKDEARDLANMKLAHVLCNEARDRSLPLPVNPHSVSAKQRHEKRGMRQSISKSCPELAKWLESQGFSSESN